MFHCLNVKQNTESETYIHFFGLSVLLLPREAMNAQHATAVLSLIYAIDAIGSKRDTPYCCTYFTT